MANEYPTNAAPLLKYNPQLDGLRFFAVLFVVCYHWLPSISTMKLSAYFGSFINFFFVLSSYLITGILFSAKAKSDKLGIPKFKVMLVFLIRRTIRIFPAYYLYLLVLLLLPVIGSEVKNNAGMYFSYLANYHIFQSHDFPAVTSHLWTLSVEEQFYIVWPLVILFIPHKHLLKAFIITIIGSVALRAICYDPALGVIQAILTQYSVDAFALGGLLAYKYTVSEKEKRAITKYFNIALYALIPLGVLVIIIESAYLSFVVHRLLFAMLSVKIIEGAVVGYKNYAGKFLQKKAVLYLGRISYGIYLYHLLVPIVFWKLFDLTYGYINHHYPTFFVTNKGWTGVLIKVISMEGVYFFIYAVIVVAIASLSAKFIEQPLNKLKVSFHVDTKKPAMNRFEKPVPVLEKE